VRVSLLSSGVSYDADILAQKVSNSGLLLIYSCVRSNHETCVRQLDLTAGHTLILTPGRVYLTAGQQDTSTSIFELFWDGPNRES
jgi:hypothetical protein